MQKLTTVRFSFAFNPKHGDKKYVMSFCLFFIFYIFYLNGPKGIHATSLDQV